jgi:hypothetical protein
MTSEPESSAGRRDLSAHIPSASVVMIGVSTTLIGLVKVAKAQMARAVSTNMRALPLSAPFKPDDLANGQSLPFISK